MREAFDRRAPAEIDDMFRVGRRLMGSQPAQRQAKLRLLVAESYIRVQRADVVGQVAHGDDRVGRTIEEADRKANDITRHDHVQDLSLAAAQHLVADRITVLDETQIADTRIRDDEILSPFDGQFTLHNAFEVREIGRAQGQDTRQPRNERMFGERCSCPISAILMVPPNSQASPRPPYVCLLI